MFEELRMLRKQIADSLGMPPFIVFSDATLAAMVERMPQSENEMLNISGVSHNKMARYGLDFMKIIQDYSGIQGLVKKESPVDFLTNEKIKACTEEMKAKKVPLSYTTLAKILVASEKAEFGEKEKSLSFYGEMAAWAKYTSIRPILGVYFEKNVREEGKSKQEEFFAAPTYNHLNEPSRKNLVMAIGQLALEKPTETLSAAVQEIRKTFARSHEPWSEKEIIFYRKALEHTNDLQFLAQTFQRSENSVKAMCLLLFKNANKETVR